MEIDRSLEVRHKLGSLSKDVFEQRTPTGKGLLAFLDSDFALFLGKSSLQ